MKAKMLAIGPIVILLLVLPRESDLAAQSAASKGSPHACDLVSNVDVSKATGRDVQNPPDSLADVEQTQSSCAFRKAGVRIALFSKAKAAAKHVAQELEVGFDTAKQAVAGVGDSAAIYFTAKDRDPKALLEAYARSQTLTVQVKGETGQSPEAARPLAVSLAKIALGKLE